MCTNFIQDIFIFLVTLFTHRVPVFATQTLWSQFILIFVHLVAIYSCESFLIHFTFVTTYQRKIENSIINIKWNRKNNESTFPNNFKQLQSQKPTKSNTRKQFKRIECLSNKCKRKMIEFSSFGSRCLLLLRKSFMWLTIHSFSFSLSFSLFLFRFWLYFVRPLLLCSCRNCCWLPMIRRWITFVHKIMFELETKLFDAKTIPPKMLWMHTKSTQKIVRHCWKRTLNETISYCLWQKMAYICHDITETKCINLMVFRFARIISVSIVYKSH